jgi:hypothetical protein
MHAISISIFLFLFFYFFIYWGWAQRSPARSLAQASDPAGQRHAPRVRAQ